MDITIQTLARQVEKVRNLQKLYFLNRAKVVLVQAKDQERILDNMVAGILPQSRPTEPVQTDLFNSHK